MEEQPDDQLMYIGSHSGYMFIGVKHEFFDGIGWLNGQLQARATEKYREKRQAVLRRVNSGFLDYEAWALKTYRQIPKDPMWDEYFRWCKEVARQCVTDCNALEKARRSMGAEFVPFNRREVVKTYPKALGGLAVIVTGEEIGPYLFRHEYQEAKKKGVFRDGMECGSYHSGYGKDREGKSAGKRGGSHKRQSGEGVSVPPALRVQAG